MTELIESEGKYRGLIENADEGIFLFNKDGNILEVNNKTLEMLGYSQEVFLKMKIQDVIPPKDREAFTQLLSQGNSSLALNLMRKDKSSLSILLSTAKITTERETFFLGIMRDFTERKKLEEEILRSNRRLLVLNTISEAISKYLSLNEILKKALENVLKIMKVEAGTVFLVDEKTKDLSLQFSQGLPADFIKALTKIPIEDGFTGYVARTGEPIYVKNVLADPRLTKKVTPEMVKRVGFHSFVGIPLKSENQVVGVMDLVSRQPRRFSSEEMTLLQSIGNQIGVAIEKALILKKEQKRSNQLALINEVSREMAKISNLDGLLKKIARSIQAKLGYPDVGIFIKEPQDDELILRAGFGVWKDVLKIGYRQKIDEGIIGWVVRNGRTMLVDDISKEPLYKKVNGVDSYSELCVPIKLGDHIFGAINLESPQPYAFDHQDVSVLETLADRLAIAIENTRLYENIGLERDKLNAILENMGEGVSIVDKNYRVHYVNNWLDNCINKANRKGTCFEAFVGRSQPCPRCPLQEVVDNLSSGTIEVTSTDHKTYLMTYTPLKTQEDRVFMLEIFKDISDRKKYEQEFLKMEKLQTAVSLARTVAHELNQPLTGIVGYCSLIKEEITEEDKLYEDFQKIERQADRISQLIRKFQNIVRLEQKSYLGNDKILDIERSSNR